MLYAYGAGPPHSRKRDEPTRVYWITTVGAPSWPRPVGLLPAGPPTAGPAVAGAPSIQTSHRPFRGDQRKVNDAAGYATERDAVTVPPAGAGPNRKPMSRAVLAPWASASSWLVRAYRLYGATRWLSRK